MPTLSNGSSSASSGRTFFFSPVPEGQACGRAGSSGTDHAAQSRPLQGSLAHLTGSKLSSRSAQVTHMAKNKQVKHRDKKACAVLVFCTNAFDKRLRPWYLLGGKWHFQSRSN